WFELGTEPKGDVKLDILDAQGNVVARAKSSAKASGGREPPESGDDEDDRPSSKQERKLEAKRGLNRFVWDLTHDGAEVIPNARVDSGNPAAGVPVSP